MSLPQANDRFWYLSDPSLIESHNESDRRELEALLRANPDLCRIYCDLCRLHTDLDLAVNSAISLDRVQELVSQGAIAPTIAVADASGRDATAGTQSPRPAVEQPTASPLLGFLAATVRLVPGGEFTVGILLIAAVIGAFAGLATLLLRTQEQKLALENGQLAAAEQPAAKISASQHCHWLSAEPRLDTPVDGKLLRISSGSAELTFAKGVRVVVEGPAMFEVVSAGRVRLDRGKLAAAVPPQAIGFTVATPAAEVIDLGTEFGVEVSDSGQTDVQVLKGKVEVKATQGARAVLDSGRAVRLSAGQAVRVSAGGAAPERVVLDQARLEAVLSSNARIGRLKLTDAASNPFLKGQPIWLGNLFDDHPHMSLAQAMSTDTFRAAADFNDLGVDRVLYGGEPIKEIAPGVRFDLTNLGWTSVGGTRLSVANDSWTHSSSAINDGGIRLRGQKMGTAEGKVDEGIGSHANSLVTFHLDDIRAAGQLLNRPFKFICDRAGINDGSIGDPGSIHLAVLVSAQDGVQTAMVDGKPARLAEQNGLWSVASVIGEPLYANGQFVSFQIPIAATSKYLTLISTSAGDNSFGDAAVWVGARLEVAGAAAPVNAGAHPSRRTADARDPSGQESLSMRSAFLLSDVVAIF